ncbi:MAG: Rrf2 family transcriptional regulator [Gemmatimonadetes bacterium]|nr:Rrf2 family transcriptional regulator [Gemmatimonadota bacterium]
MRITTQAEYGLLCALHLARRSPGVAVSAREVAQAEQLPGQYCEKIFRQLRQARLVESVRGASGGFRLARQADAISLKDVIDATEGRTFQVNCADHPVGVERCQSDQCCSLRPVWRALQARIDGLLDQIRLADLLQEEATVAALVNVQPPTRPWNEPAADAPAGRAAFAAAFTPDPDPAE